MPPAAPRALRHPALDTTRPYPGRSTGTAIRARHRVAVLTNKPERPTRQILKGLGMDGLFSDVIGGDSAHGRKPDPAGLLDLVARADVTPAETLLVGDSPVDLATARRAGTHICLARYGFGYRFASDAFGDDEWFIDDARRAVGDHRWTGTRSSSRGSDYPDASGTSSKRPKRRSLDPRSPSMTRQRSYDSRLDEGDCRIMYVDGSAQNMDRSSARLEAPP